MKWEAEENESPPEFKKIEEIVGSYGSKTTPYQGKDLDESKETD
jgi:hypothetical protein